MIPSNDFNLGQSIWNHQLTNIPFIMFHTLQVLSQPDVFCNGGPENRCILVIINFPSSAISWVGWVAFTTTNTTTYYYFNY